MSVASDGCVIYLGGGGEEEGLRVMFGSRIKKGEYIENKHKGLKEEPKE